MTEPPEFGAPPPPPPPPYGATPQYAAGSQYGGVSPAYAGGDTYLDPVSGLVLPTGVQLASHGRRIGAYFLSLVLIVFTLVIGWVIWVLILWGRGQTPTYQVLGMRCWRPETREVPGFWWMALREVVGGFVEGLLSFITELVSFILFLTTRERKSLHEYLAGTVVLYEPGNRLGR